MAGEDEHDPKQERGADGMTAYGAVNALAPGLMAGQPGPDLKGDNSDERNPDGRHTILVRVEFPS